MYSLHCFVFIELYRAIKTSLSVTETDAMTAETAETQELSSHSDVYKHRPAEIVPLTSYHHSKFEPELFDKLVEHFNKEKAEVEPLQGHPT